MTDFCSQVNLKLLKMVTLTDQISTDIGFSFEIVSYANTTTKNLEFSIEIVLLKSKA